MLMEFGAVLLAGIHDHAVVGGDTGGMAMRVVSAVMGMLERDSGARDQGGQQHQHAELTGKRAGPQAQTAVELQERHAL